MKNDCTRRASHARHSGFKVEQAKVVHCLRRTGGKAFTREWQVDPNLSIYSEQVKGEDGRYHFTDHL